MVEAVHTHGICTRGGKSMPQLASISTVPDGTIRKLEGLSARIRLGSRAMISFYMDMRKTIRFRLQTLPVIDVVIHSWAHFWEGLRVALEGPQQAPLLAQLAAHC